jgi:hypothetical protein
MEMLEGGGEEGEAKRGVWKLLRHIGGGQGGP